MRHQGSECRKKGGTKTEPWDKTWGSPGDKEELVKETEKERPGREENSGRMQCPGSRVKKDSGAPSELKNGQCLRPRVDHWT